MSAASENSADETNPPTKNALDHETSPTLPNVPHGELSDGSVMWAAPSPKGVGPRSGGLSGETDAISATRGTVAQQRGPSGAVIAAGLTPRLPQAAAEMMRDRALRVIEMASVGVVTSPAKLQFDNEKDVLSEDEAFAIVKRARAVVSGDVKNRRTRMDTPPSAKTIANYKRKCRIIDDAMAQLPGPLARPLTITLSKYASSKPSYFAMRAALKWRALGTVKEVLKKQDSLQSLVMRDPGWLACVRSLESALNDFDEIVDLNHEECLELGQNPLKQTRSKKRTLRLLKPGWQDQFLSENDHSPTYRAAGLLMRHCGMRPEELQKGVIATMAGQHIVIRIEGAKVREHAGQPWREFALRCDMLPTWFIDEVALAGAKAYAADSDRMRAHLLRVSERLYPRSDKEGAKKVILSVYVFRHALATDLRDAGWTTEQIAAVLGESVSETAKHYGFRGRSGSGRKPAVAIVHDTVETARPVRLPDRSGLDRVLQAKHGRANPRRN